MKPKVIIDGLSLLSPLTGVGRYNYEIASRLEEFKQLDLTYFYGYYSKQLLQTHQNKRLKNLKSFIKKIPLAKKITRKIIMLLSKFYTKTYDIYWQPNFIPLEEVKAKKVITSVHDFSSIIHKEFHPKERVEYFEKYFFKNIKRSDILICFSQFTKNEILQYFDFEENQIEVIPHGVKNDFLKTYDDLTLNFEIPKKFILTVGSIEPRKNLIGLLKAYNMLDENLKKEYKLVLVGFKGWENREIMELINKNKTNIHYLGFVTDEELAKVYNLASLFVFPSFYEGFGLPPLEAMACGTPVVTSNLTSLPEVCEDAVLYCNPHNEIDIKEKMEKILKDKTLQKDLSIKGKKQAQKFSWEKSALAHLDILKNTLNSRGEF